MMKVNFKSLIYTFSAMLVLSSLQSCYKDLSTEGGEEIPDIVISGLEPEAFVTYGQDVSFSVTVEQQGRDESDFEYLWTMDLLPGQGKNRVEMGEGLSIDLKIAQTPSDIPYMLMFTATDKFTGLSRTEGCRIYVESSLGEGLLVAHTKDGGVTSEFDLLAQQSITYGYTSQAPRYTRGLYALANGEPFPGRVQSVSESIVSEGAAYNVTRFMVGTQDHMYALDPLSFKMSVQDGPLFNGINESRIDTRMLFNFGGYEAAALINGSFYVCPTLFSSAYSKIPCAAGAVFTPENLAYNPMREDPGAEVFDSETGNFYFLSGWNAFQSSFNKVSFNTGVNLVGAECLGAGAANKGNCGFLLRDASGQHHIFINYGEESSTHYTLDGDGLDNVVSVAFCDNADVMYYTDGKDIYSVVMTGGRAINNKLTWKPDSADERVTKIIQYRQAWYGLHDYSQNSYEFLLPMHRLQMVIVTYNEKTGEGRIYLRPFNVSTGKFTFKDNGSYGGFGEITAITTTLR